MVAVVATLLGAMVCVRGTEAIAGQYYTAASHSLNNDVVGVDYKLTESQQNKVIDQLQYGYLSKVDLDESAKYLNTSTDRDIDLSGYEHDNGTYNKSMRNDQATAKSYLLKNNILERRGILKYVGGTNPFEFERCEDVYAKAWNEQFEAAKDDLLKELDSGDLGKSAVMEGVSGLVDECLEILGETMEEPEEDEIWLGLKKYKKKFKKAVEGLSGKASVNAMAMEYVEQITEYAKSFKQNYGFQDGDTVIKTELLMLLSKAAFGAKESRTVVWNAPAVRNGDTYSQSTKDYWNGGTIVSNLGGYWDTGQFKGGANFETGDFYYYVSSNVYEEYLKDLLDRGLVFEDEFGSLEAASDFLEDYESFGEETPEWASSLGVCSAGVRNSLGSGYFFQENGIGLSLVCRHPQFFSDETLTTMEVYQYVEDFLRVTEKDISETEAEIVTYKYGLNYLAPYSGSQLKTLEFLIAKGILNFEDSSQFCDLTAPMDYSRLYQLLYRVASEKARYDFSQVQLTDSENYWVAKGYAESDVGMVDSASGFVVNSNATEIEGEEVAASTDSWFDVVYAEKKEFLVTYKLTKDLDWFYDGTSLETMESGEDLPSTVLSVETGKMKYNRKATDVWELKLEIAADSAKKAIKTADKHLSTSSISGNSMPTVVKINEQGKSEDPEEYTMIPQSAVRQNFSKISVIEDKVLVNIETGCQAILFPDNGYAMVGNTIIKTDGLIMEEAENEVYYNLKVIMSLVDTDFLQKTGLKVTVFHCSKKFTTYTVNVKSEYDSAFNRATIATLKATKKMVSSDPDADVQVGDLLHYYKVDDLNDGLNTMVRKFSLSIGDVWLVVDFDIILPSVSEVTDTDGDIYKAITAVVQGTDDYEQSKILNAFYTRPNGSKVLESWWDSNYVASNALINFLLGTKGIQYVTTGYLTPSITVLGGASKFEGAEDAWAAKLFQGIEFLRYDSVGDSDTTDAEILGYVGGGGSSWYKNFFSSEDFVEGLDFTDEESTLLQAMIAEHRTIDFIAERKIETYGGHSFGSTFFLTNAGVLYKNTQEDYRMEPAISLYGNSKGHSYKVDSLKLTTRLPSRETPKVDTGTVVSGLKGAEDGQEMLYRGVVTIDGEKYYKLTPIGDVIHLDQKDKLYNGAYLAVGQNRASEDYGKFSFVVDRGTNSGGAPTQKPRYSELSDVFAEWAKTYLGNCNYVDYEKLPLRAWCSVNDTVKKKITSKEKNEYLFVNSSTEEISDIEETEPDAFFEEFKKKAALLFGSGEVKDEEVYLSLAENLSWLKLRKSSKYDAKTDLMPKLGFSIKDMETTGNLEKDSYFTSVLDDVDLNVGLAVTKFEDVLTDRYCTKGSIAQTLAIAVPNFYVSTSQYTITKENEKDSVYKLLNGGAAVSFCLSNLYSSGILKSIQENIIAHSVGTTSLSSLDAGDVVTIAGVRFFVDKEQGESGGVWLTSAVLNMLGSKSQLKNSACTWKAETNTKFTSRALELISSTLIQCDGKAYSLSGYVTKGTKSAKKSGKYLNIEVGGLKKTASTKKNGIIYLENHKTVMGYKKINKKETRRKIKKGNTGNYKYLRVRFSFNGELQVRPLNAEKTEWTLTNTTISGNLGDSTDFFFYDEELSKSENAKVSIDVSTSWFHPSSAFLAVKNQFLKVHAQLFAKDFKTWMLMIICAVAIYLCVISWIAYLVLHYGVFHQLFTIINTGPERSHGVGFDVVSFFTFKMFNLDDDPPLHRIVVIQILCIVVAAVCINLV